MKKTAKIIVALGLVLALALLAGCGKKEEAKKIKVGASPAPHAEILKVAKDELKKAGYELEIVEFQDYVKPNKAVEDGEIDANFFQHLPYLKEFNKENKTHVVSVGTVHYEPLGIYKGSKKKLTELKKGDKIAVPNDTTNEARALLLLQDNGVLKLKKGAGLTATKKDIVKNKYGVEIYEVEAAAVPRNLKETAFSVINGNYALNAKLTSKDAVAYEKSDSQAAKEYANILAVKEGNKKSDSVKALVKAVQSDAVKEFIEKKYKGAVIPKF